MVASYCSILKYDTECGPKVYCTIEGVPQVSVLGPLLWNVIYDGLLNLAFQIGARLVAKHVEDINYIFDTTFGRICSVDDLSQLEAGST